MIRPMLFVAALLPGIAQSQDADAGRETYLDHCATCHGLDAIGNGPTAAVLTLQPADLTQLSAKNGGTFPTFRVVARIDGRDPLVAHGSPMPIYGDFFDGRGVAIPDAAGQPIMTSQPIVDLVAYLNGIQD